MFRFSTYTEDELRACGESFAAAFARLDESSTAKWTKHVLQWFADTKADGMHVCSSVCGNEYMVDLCHLDYPPGPAETWIERWSEALRKGCAGMKLSLESEWGRYGDARMSRAMVLDDAMKLALLRADAKVMIFASQAGRDRSDLLTALQRLREISDDDTPWLCIDVPWSSGPPHDIAHWVLEARRITET
jgi:hypothetical protein